MDMTLVDNRLVMRSIRIDRAHIAWLRFALEAHDGLAIPTTRTGDPNVVDLIVAPDFEAELDELLDALAEEVPIVRLPPPLRSPLDDGR